MMDRRRISARLNSNSLKLDERGPGIAAYQWLFIATSNRFPSAVLAGTLVRATGLELMEESP